MRQRKASWNTRSDSTYDPVLVLCLQNDLAFLSKCWKLHGRPTWCMIIRENDIKSVILPLRDNDLQVDNIMIISVALSSMIMNCFWTLLYLLCSCQQLEVLIRRDDCSMCFMLKDLFCKIVYIFLDHVCLICPHKSTRVFSPLLLEASVVTFKWSVLFTTNYTSLSHDSPTTYQWVLRPFVVVCRGQNFGDFLDLLALFKKGDLSGIPIRLGKLQVRFTSSSSLSPVHCKVVWVC